VRFAEYDNYLAAQIVAGRFEAEMIPVVVENKGFFPGEVCAALWVPKPLAHRARWICAWPPPSDAELTFLARGELADP
jgi:hypothetical protein